MLDGRANGISVLATLADCIAEAGSVPDYLICGLAPSDGLLTDPQRVVLLDGIARGMHIVNGLHEFLNDDAEFVAARWDNPLWRIYDWTLLALGLFHGLNGLRWIIDDYVRSPAKRLTVKAVLYSVTGVLFAYGTLTIITFG